MNEIIIATIIIILLSGCTRTENGLVFGVPDYEKRYIKVSQVDLDILIKTNQILKDKTVWNKDSVRICKESKKLSLYCALEKASIEVTGVYVHRQPTLQEIRFIINDKYKNRWKVHRLADFNVHPETSFNDIKSIINRAIKVVKNKLSITKCSGLTPETSAFFAKNEKNRPFSL